MNRGLFTLLIVPRAEPAASVAELSEDQLDVYICDYLDVLTILPDSDPESAEDYSISALDPVSACSSH